jgi:hypothetical protein
MLKGRIQQHCGTTSMYASGTTSNVDVGGAGAPSPHLRMASSIVPVLYALQDCEIHGVASVDCKAKASDTGTEDLELSYRVDEVVAYSRRVISYWGLEKFECSIYPMCQQASL